MNFGNLDYFFFTKFVVVVDKSLNIDPGSRQRLPAFYCDQNSVTLFSVIGGQAQPVFPLRVTNVRSLLKLKNFFAPRSAREETMILVEVEESNRHSPAPHTRVVAQGLTPYRDQIVTTFFDR